MKAIRFI